MYVFMHVVIRATDFSDQLFALSCHISVLVFQSIRIVPSIYLDFSISKSGRDSVSPYNTRIFTVCLILSEIINLANLLNCILSKFRLTLDNCKIHKFREIRYKHFQTFAQTAREKFTEQNFLLSYAVSLSTYPVDLLLYNTKFSLAISVM